MAKIAAEGPYFFAGKPALPGESLPAAVTCLCHSRAKLALREAEWARIQTHGRAFGYLLSQV